MKSREIKTQLLADKPIEISTPTLQIDGYYVKELSCSVRDSLDEKTKIALGTGLHIQTPQVMSCPTPSVELNIQVGPHAKDPKRFRINLGIQSDEKEGDSPYVFSIELVGHFSLRAERVIKASSLFYYRNAVMLLYSAAREIVASVMSRGPFPAFILPTLAFGLSDDSSFEDIVETALQVLESGIASDQPHTTTIKASKKKTAKRVAKK
jgi:preprotein translocase subunit SecB